MSGSIDVDVARWCTEHRHPALIDVFRFLETLGTAWEFFAAAALIGMLVVAWLQLWAGVPRLVLAVLVTFTVTAPLKPLIDRPRPYADLSMTMLSGPSMPSSHAILTSTLVTAVILAPWWTSRRLRVVAASVGALGCVVAGVAMVYLGGHWLSDVLAGWALGVGITATAMLALKRLGLP